MSRSSLLVVASILGLSLSLVSVTAFCGTDTSAALEQMTCTGDRQELFLSNHMPYVHARIDDRRGWFVVDTGTNRSGFSKEWLDETSPVGEKVKRDSFEYFEVYRDVTLRVDAYDHDTGDVKQAGMVGTDFIARHPTTFDYSRGTLYRAAGKGFCDDKTLRGAGLYPVPIRSDDLMTYDAHPAGRRNNPMIDVEVNGMRFATQLDTGLSDSWSKSMPLTMNVNESFVNHLRAEGYSIELFGEPTRLTTCQVGVYDTIQPFRIVGGMNIRIIDTDGRQHTIPGVTLYLKTGSKKCGGLNSWEEPMMQIGASWFEKWGVFSIDPVTKRFWVPSM